VPTYSHPCVIFALSREAQGFFRHFPLQRRIKDAPCWAGWCGNSPSVLVLQTGVGIDRMRTAMEWLCRQEPRPDFLIQAGFAGALHESMTVGRVLAATEVVDTGGRTWPVPSVRTAHVDVTPGRLITVARLVGDPAAKIALAQKHEALAVDMESAAFVDVCSQQNVAFACVRAISDDVHTALSPRLVRLLSGPSVSWWRFLLAILTGPRLIGECLRLARDTRLASDRLGQTLREVILHVMQ
jgi:adenosylhomocysteine nucleosidase